MAITRDMPIAKIVQDHPDTVRVFFAHGLICVGCAAARYESLEQGAKAHGIDVDALVEALNDAVTDEQAEVVEE